MAAIILVITVLVIVAIILVVIVSAIVAEWRRPSRGFVVLLYLRICFTYLCIGLSLCFMYCFISLCIAGSGAEWRRPPFCIIVLIKQHMCLNIYKQRCLYYFLVSVSLLCLVYV